VCVCVCVRLHVRVRVCVRVLDVTTSIETGFAARCVIVFGRDYVVFI
jgi:hypothetical protein